MGGWYNPHGLYVTEELGGLSLSRFLAALEAEGVRLGAGINLPLHLHPVFRDVDVYGRGAPTNAEATTICPWPRASMRAPSTCRGSSTTARR